MNCSSLIECMIRVPCWPWTNSAYVCSYCCECDWPYSKLLLLVSIDVLWGRRAYVISPHSCAILLSEYTATLIITGFALLFVGWMYDTGTALALNEQCVRLQLLLHVWLTLTLSTRSCYHWCSIDVVWDRRSYIISPHSCAILLSKCTATLITTGSALLFVDWMYDTGAVLTLHKQIVRL